eukprot:TRINITY_DN530_c0_g1_i5.p2 TRINITY_DN530_c0_g1~~TRINITY_DN530_c0_g1_i5.p2  ORF type:complete len:106 (+),score=27.45 TRINITY_DN530_c0_g1_i5:301-618(+)
MSSVNSNENVMQSSRNPIFLMRNQKKGKQTQGDYFCENNIEYMTYPNSSRLHNRYEKKEDLLISYKKVLKRKNQIQIEDEVQREFKKICKVNEWINNKMPLNPNQ